MPTNKDMSEELRLKLEEVIRKSNAQKKILKKILDQLNQETQGASRSIRKDQ